MRGLESRNAALQAELSDRQHSQEASDARLRFATKASGLGIWELNCETFELFASATCRANFGFREDEPFGYEELRATVHPDDRTHTHEALARCIETGDDYKIEYRVIRRNGERAWLQIRGQSERTDDGRVARMAGTSQDVTQANMRRERTRVLLELSEMLNATDDPGDIAFAAAEALGQLFGVSRAGYGTVDLVDETISIERDWNAPGIKSLAGKLNFRDYGSYIEDLQRGTTVVIANARTDPRTISNADALKAISALSFINMPVTESDGLVALLYLNHAEPRAWTDDELAFVRKVALRTRMAVKRREVERELQELAATLESQVRERTAALMRTEEALRQSQKMEAVGQLTGGLAHDFNNLLAGVSASLEILERRIGEGRVEDAKRYIGAARASTKRAASLTQRLLAFSRMQTLEPQAIDVNKRVMGMEELIRRTVGPEIEVEVVGAVGLWPTKADPAQLENALLNLCLNGRDAMAPQGGRLTIETANKWIDDRTATVHAIPPGQYISMCVSDTGQGMSPDTAARAFDPFFTTKPMGEGTGLGLSMVYGFVRQSGGEVRIYSELGKGTTVCLYLPRHTGPMNEEAPLPEEKPEQSEGETIVVIEDEPTIREFLAEELRESGYRVLEAQDGRTGLRVLEHAGKVDLLITDVGLPGGMNGRQVADAARIARPDLKTLFITGFADNAAVGDGRMPPGMEVMTKPFDLSVLATRIRALIAR